MNSIDFLPDAIKAKRARRRRLARQGYLLAFAVGATVLWAYLGQRRVSRAQAELTQLRRQSANLTSQLALKTQLERQLGDLMIMERISKTLGSRVNVLDVSNELERLLPASMFLSHLTLETVNQKIEPSGASYRNPSARVANASRQKTGGAKRVRLRITGLAPTDVAVANFIGQLSASPLFEDVNMGYTKNTVTHKRRAREFQASFYVAR